MAKQPLTLVIYGASGDLTARKLIPSLYRLDRKRRLPEELHVVGVSRSPYSDESFREKMVKAIHEFAPDDWDEAAWNRFAPRLHYVSADAAREGGLVPLKKWLESHAGPSLGCRLFYLAVSHTLYPEIIKQLAQSGLNQHDPTGSWSRLIIEKPFGHDLTSARQLNREVRSYFQEDQIYRIDHYLGKETVQNILVFRFANTLFEPLWNHKYIDHVQITVAETVLVTDRADYYDKAGVLRDMFQNHLLQVMALVAMEAPSTYNADKLRNEKVKVLDAISVQSIEDSSRRVVTGQYEGYHSAKGVAANSITPTYACVELNIDNWRWRGVPFFLRSGKGLSNRSSEILIQFHCPPHLMFSLPPGTVLKCNQLSIHIQPDEGIHINFQTKVPDTDVLKLTPSDLEFHYHDQFGNKAIPEAYERLLQDAILGDAALFMRSDEIERAWEIMDPIIAAVEQSGKVQPQEYKIGSEGPACADAYLGQTGRQWKSLKRS